MVDEYGSDYAARQLERRASRLRRLIKAAYLASTLKEVDGPTLDFGCGAGQLLERLPPGSTGLEINALLVSELQRRGLDARLYDAGGDDFALSSIEPGRYRTFVASHVLEHFVDAAQALRRIAVASERLRLSRLVLVVPGWKGYQSDNTHKTFVDAAYLERNQLLTLGPFRLAVSRSFPINREWFGRFFVYNETVFVWDR